MQFFTHVAFQKEKGVDYVNQGVFIVKKSLKELQKRNHLVNNLTDCEVQIIYSRWTS